MKLLRTKTVCGFGFLTPTYHRSGEYSSCVTSDDGLSGSPRSNHCAAVAGRCGLDPQFTQPLLVPYAVIDSLRQRQRKQPRTRCAVRSASAWHVDDVFVGH